MPILPFLLRLLLCLALVANGIGPARASGWAESAHAAVASSIGVSDAPPDAPGDCHGAGGDAPTPESAHDVQDVPHAGMPGDCCETDACPCTCVAQAHAAITVAHVHGATPPPDGGLVARHRGTSHPAPRLPHLIRPPIG